MLFSFILFLTLFALIGLSSAFKSKGTKSDYYLANSSVPAPLVGLSAVATNNSGYMFIGVIGFTYVSGLSSIWLMFGLIFGDFLGSTFIHSRLKKATDRTNEVTFAGVISNWNGKSDLITQRIIATITLLFLLAYSSAQLVAGSKALHVLLDWPTWSGALLGAVLVSLYCFSGGIRASIWTDVAQSIVMVFAMILLLGASISSFGGIKESVSAMMEVDGYLNLFPKELAFPGVSGILLFIIGWTFGGLSVIGQPHIMVRFMTLSDSAKMRNARIWYFSWYIIFFALTICVGMLARIYLNTPDSFDAELALPTMAKEMLPPFFAGVILAGIFAATISTADSLVLSCSSALTHDILPHKIEKTWLLKTGTVVITIVALVMALFNNQSVFNLVIMAWSALASAFGPLLIYLALGGKPKITVKIIAIFAGLSVALLWRYLEWHNVVYEGFPAIVAGLVVLYWGNVIGEKR